MKLRNNKGITLIVLTITIVVLLIVTSITIYHSRSQLDIKNVNNLYSDIESINTKVSDYYLKNNSLPIFENNAYISNSTELKLLLKSNGGTDSSVNPNDDGEYYVIDLSKLENLTLNYGRDYKNWTDDSTFTTYQDIYIINKVTHQIYYPLGITLNETTFFSRDVDTQTVDKVVTSSIPDTDFQLTSIQVNKNTVEGTTNVILDADIILSISTNFQKNTLKYAWKLDGDTSEMTFTDFTLDSANSAKLMSKQLSDSTSYYLYIKILDINGDEHTIEKAVTID